MWRMRELWEMRPDNKKSRRQIRWLKLLVSFLKSAARVNQFSLIIYVFKDRFVSSFDVFNATCSIIFIFGCHPCMTKKENEMFLIILSGLMRKVKKIILNRQKKFKFLNSNCQSTGHVSSIFSQFILFYILMKTIYSKLRRWYFWIHWQFSVATVSSHVLIACANKSNFSITITGYLRLCLFMLF